jgi:rhodanese-related sulfurtransferase
MLMSLMGLLGNAGAAEPIPNPKIDAEGFLRVTHEAMAARETHRLTEAQFLAMAAEPGTVVLDARSRDRYALLHVRGAINLPFTDMTIESMRRVLPDPKAKILIYCNNNFENDEIAFATKAAPAALNLSTFVSLYTYGYRNVYELGPMLDVKRTRIPLVAR